MSKQIYIGWAQTDITPDRPFYVHGQMYHRISSYVHDPLTATALVLDNGEDQAIFISCDMAEPPVLLMADLRARVGQLPGLDPEKVSVSVIHTHNSFAFGCEALFPDEIIIPEEMQAKLDAPDNIMSYEEGTAFLLEKLSTLVEDAWAARAPGGVSYAQDYAAVAFNRRPVFRQEDGSTESVMYGACSKDNFVRMEGTADHAADMLYTWDLNGELTGVFVDIPCPSQVYELHCFVSADYWAATRDHIREALGNIFILPVCGAAGDQNPLDLIRISKTNEEALRLWNAQESEVFRNFDMGQECDDIGSRIAEAVQRGYRKARNRIETRPELRHTQTFMKLPIRQVSQADYEEAQATVDEALKQYAPGQRMGWGEKVRLFEPCGVITRWQLQQETTEAAFDFHTVRVGKAVIATNPFELFVDFGMRIKARCKAEQVFLAQLSNGACGYLPTEAAVNGGSYSSKPASTTCGPDGGKELVERTIQAINALFE